MSIRDVVERIAGATLPATFENEDIYLPMSICPKPGDAVYLDQAAKTAYCSSQGKCCPKLQLSQPTEGYVLCRAASSYEIAEKEGGQHV